MFKYNFSMPNEKALDALWNFNLFIRGNGKKIPITFAALIA